MNKHQLRQDLIKKRSEVTKAYEKACQLVKNFSQIDLPENAIVSLYFPLKSEVDTRPLMDYLWEKGVKICLPVVEEKDRPLIFNEYTKKTALIKNDLGILEPLPESETMNPNVILLPLLGFDRFGNRLGFGGGYYDRTLQSLRQKSVILAIGVGFACQEVDLLPKEGWDETLNMIITEKEVIKVV